MSGNLFGSEFRVVTFGESHGKYIGLVIDGVNPGLEISVEGIQKELNRRRPGQSDITTPRKEKDRIQIISGIFEGKSTGTPICMLIPNEDTRPQDYETLKKVLRPGHASYTFLKKYGIFDYRGGGRASGRETATRVAAGALARQFLAKKKIQIYAYTRQIGDVEISEVDLSVIEKNSLRSPDLKAAEKMKYLIKETMERGDSLGGVVEIIVKNCPVALGEPVFNKLEADLASALMSIGAVKGFEMGSGFKTARLKGSEQNDAYFYDEKEKRIRTKTNNSGGVLGGISNGEDLVMRIAVKPPSSIRKKMKTIDWDRNPVEFGIEGRHDPCICPRVVPVAEAMVALVLIDHILLQDRISKMDTLKALREKIDTIDHEIALLLAQRFNYIKKIASTKIDQNMIIKDDNRQKMVIKNWLNAAKTLNLNPSMTKEIINTVLKFSRRKQQEILL